MAEIMKAGVGNGISNRARPELISWPLAGLLPKQDRGTSVTRSDWLAIRIASG